MRILALDFGFKKIGVATTDMSKTIAYPYKTIFTKNDLSKTVEHLLSELKEILLEVEEILIGLPLHLNGLESDMSITVRKFSEILESKSGKKIKLIDERLSSKQVEKELNSNFNLNSKKASKIVDQLSASLILNSYLL